MTVTAAVACVLASTVLLPLFSSSLWFAVATGGVIAVAATGALTRLRTLPVAACLAAGVAGLLLYLNLVFEARHSLLFVIPTPGSLARLWDLSGTGMHDANGYAPPAPNLPGLLLLAAGGVGITAVLTDLIAVRLRSTAQAGPGHPGAGRGGPAGRARLDRPGAVRAAARARPAPEQGVLLGPGHRRRRRRRRRLPVAAQRPGADRHAAAREPSEHGVHVH